MEKEKNHHKRTNRSKMLKKITVIIVILIVLLVTAWTYINRDGSAWRYINRGTTEEIGDVIAEHVSELYVNIADHAIMKKGKLLNEKYKIEYQKLPDTLYTLEYGEYLYPLFYEDHKKDEENNWFSPIDEHDLEVFNKNLDSMVDIKNMKYMVQYLNLVAKKAVSPPVYDCSGCIFTDIDMFNTYYRDEFSSYGMTQLPLVLKEKIIEFYNSNEGQRFRYVEKGNQSSSDLIWSGNLTGNEKTDYAILFKDGDNELEDNYLLVVFAGSNTGYYIVYSEKFYDKVILEALKTNVDVKEYYRQIYMNADDFVETANDGIVLKQMNEVDRVLVYNKEFDKMVNYHLRPSVDIEKEER